MRAPVLALSLGLVCLAVGCAAPPGDRWPIPAGPTLVVGTGESDFEDIGPTVSLIHGPQGGYHVWISVRCYGLTPPVQITYGERDARTGMELTMGTLLEVAPLDDPGPWHVVAGLAGRLDGYDPSAYLERPISIHAEVQDGAQRRLTDEHATTIHGVTEY